ncbi:MAG: hypothetical protein KC492_13305, partial [Myxococcales bacterium]|nr:hypothetical protein [Myxococcales bacterium]
MKHPLFIAALVLAIASVGCKKSEGEPCGLHKDCASGLLCFNIDLHGPNRCMSFSAASKACRTHALCRRMGRCSPDRESGSCRPKSEADCRQAAMCRDLTTQRCYFS